MRVYGDHPRPTSLAELFGDTAERLSACGGEKGLAAHAALVGAFLSAAELGRAIADADLDTAGEDAPSVRAEAAMDLTTMLAGAVMRSWRSGFAAGALEPGLLLARLRRQPLEETCLVRPVEGYALNAVYPEAYGEAARAFGPAAFDHVIGLRSIGFGLAAMVGAVAGMGRPVSLRPVGPPFARRVAPGEALRRRLLANPGERFAVVDEGPGLSGSSFGGVGDLLEEGGVSPDRVVYFPSHAGESGREASLRHRRRWSAAIRTSVPFDLLAIRTSNPAHRLGAWVADLVGEATAPLNDLSAGAWRDVAGRRDAPVWPHAERRKFLYEADGRRWLLKFAGLGSIGEGKLQRAAALHGAGFCPEPHGLRHGFLVEQWVEGRAVDPHQDRAGLIARLGAYIGFRARAFPTGGGGAPLATLVEMARINLAEAGLDCPRLPEPAETSRLERRVRRVVTDNRMHLWEWIRAPDGRLLKTDAVDHAEGHDLVGCQDPAWDVAGAAIEFDLSDAELDTLCAHVAAAAWPVDPGLLALMRTAYVGFQIGCWRMAAEGQGGGEAARCEARVEWYARRLRPAVLRAPAIPSDTRFSSSPRGPA